MLMNQRFKLGGPQANMKEVAGGLMQLLAIIMILITLAVSTAAVSQMIG